MNLLLQEMFLLSNPNAIQKIENVSLAVTNSTRLIPKMFYRRQRIWFCWCSADALMSLIHSSLKIQPQRPNSDLWKMCTSFAEVKESSMHIIGRQNFALGIYSTKTRQNCQWPPLNVYVCYLKCHTFPYT